MNELTYNSLIFCNDPEMWSSNKQGLVVVKYYKTTDLIILIKQANLANCCTFTHPEMWSNIIIHLDSCF